MKKIIVVLFVLAALLCAAFVPEDGLPSAQAEQPGTVEEPTEQEILAYIDALIDVDYEGDDNDIAYCWQNECYTWNDVYFGNASEEAEDARIQSEHCEALNRVGWWDANSGCPDPYWD